MKAQKLFYLALTCTDTHMAMAVLSVKSVCKKAQALQKNGEREK